MGGRQSRFSRLQHQGEGAEEQGGESSGSDRLYLDYKQLKAQFDADNIAKVHISVEESGQPLKDVALDTTLRGLFYDTTEPGGDANLATQFLLEKKDEHGETYTISGYLSSVVIPYTTLWVSQRPMTSNHYRMQFRADDEPATMHFRNKPGTDLWSIYTTKPKDEEVGSKEGEEAEAEEAEKTAKEDKEKIVYLVPEHIVGIPPRTNPIQARDQEGPDYVYNVKFSPVVERPQLAKRKSTKTSAELEDPQTTPAPQEAGEEEKEQGETEKEPGENERETLQPQDDPKEAEA